MYCPYLLDKNVSSPRTKFVTINFNRLVIGNITYFWPWKGSFGNRTNDISMLKATMKVNLYPRTQQIICMYWVVHGVRIWFLSHGQIQDNHFRMSFTLKTSIHVSNFNHWRQFQWLIITDYHGKISQKHTQKWYTHGFRMWRDDMTHFQMNRFIYLCSRYCVWYQPGMICQA